MNPYAASRCAVCLLATAIACGPRGEAERTGESSEPITGGQAESGFPAVGWTGSCTATLITPSWVLSAKHCGSPSTFSTGQNASVSHAIDQVVQWYPSETGSSVSKHDLALLHLASPIQDIRPVEIFTGPLPSVGTTCTAVGFGVDSNGNFGSKRSATEIIDTVGPYSQHLTDLITLFTIVASGIRVHAGTGLGAFHDSGGPLFCNGRIAGTVSGNPGDSVSGADMSHLWYTALDSDGPSHPNASAWIANVVSDNFGEPFISSITGGPNLLDVFVRGTDGSVQHKWWPNGGSSWKPSNTTWEPLGGFVSGTPEAVTFGGNSIDVFARGGDPNPATDVLTSMSPWHLSWNGNTWSWEQLPGSPGGQGVLGHLSPLAWSIAGITTNPLFVFAVDNNGTAWYDYKVQGNSWQPWNYLPLTDTAGNPVAFQEWGPIKVVAGVPDPRWATVFAVANNSELLGIQIYWNDFSGPAVSSGWTHLGGSVVGVPSLVTWPPTTINVFAKSTDNNAYDKWFASGNWFPSLTDWEGLGGPMSAAPAGTSYNWNQITLLAPQWGSNCTCENPNQTAGLIDKAWNGSQWAPSLTTWDVQGGTQVGAPAMTPSPGQGIWFFVLDSTFTPNLLTYTASTQSFSVASPLGGTASW